MIVKLLGAFALPVNGNRVSCGECTERQDAQGADPIFEIVVWKHRIMLCARHLDTLVAGCRLVRRNG